MSNSAALTLCLDVGNTNLYAGIFNQGGTVQLRFRKTSHNGASSDEYGLFLKAVLRENNLNPDQITAIGICSVVPDAVYSIRHACQKYFSIEPFLLRTGVKTGLQVSYRNPQEVGADRIANAVGAVRHYPGHNCIVVDFGTATTFDAITAERKYLGGAIVPGLRIGMKALEEQTAKLPTVEIVKARQALGRSTVESIQSGLFFGAVGMVRELSLRITNECFKGVRPIILATGGFSRLFDESDLFDAILPDLVLEGLYQAMQLNRDELVNKGVAV